MTVEEVRKCFAALGRRERLIAKLAVLAGMRPGEIFAMTWGRTYSNACRHYAAGLPAKTGHA